jgi:hypothetical protein
MTEKMRTIEEMHQMTIDELREYCTKAMTHWTCAVEIKNYRIRTDDIYNPLLLTGGEIVEDEEE